MADNKRDFPSPKVVFIFSGKRKSGKGFVAKKLSERFYYDRCGIIRLSGPLKDEYARQNGLDFHRLLDSSNYKELYREDMIKCIHANSPGLSGSLPDTERISRSPVRVIKFPG